MKKMLAMMLALMLLLGMVAVAETPDPVEATDVTEAVDVAEPFDPAKSALFVNLTGMTIDVNNEENPQNINLEDMGVTLILDSEDVPRLVLTVDKGDEVLSFAVAEVVDGKLRVGLKGVDRTFEQDLSEIPGMDSEGMLTSLRQILPTLMGARLPELKIVALPKLDLAGLVALLGAESVEANGVTTTKVDIPAEVTSLALQAAVEFAKSTAENISQVRPGVQLLEQLLESGFSFAIRGDITDKGAEQTASIGIYMASEGETAEEPTLILNTTSAENNYVLAIDLPTEDSSYTMGQLSVVTDTAAETLDVGVDFAGMASVAMKVHKENELQCFEMAFNSFGSETTAIVQNGTKDGQDYSNFKSDLGNGLTYNCEVTGNGSEDSYEGSFNVNISNNGSTVDFNSSFFEILSDFDLAATLEGFTMPAETAAFDTLTSDEINTAFAPVQEALTSVLGALIPAEEVSAEEAPVEDAPAA